MSNINQSPRSSSLSSPPSTSSLDGRPTPHRTNSHKMRLSPSPSAQGHAHRPSFTEQLRGLPPSPRQQRHMSLSQVQVQELWNNPPAAGQSDPRFAGRDWQHISVGELVDPEDLRFVELDTGIEEATNLLTQSSLPVLLIRSSRSERSALGTFDYRDLTQYLLFATGQLIPPQELLQFYQSLAKKAQNGQQIPLEEVKALGSQEEFMTLPHTAQLTKAVEIFGGGTHRIIITREGTSDVVGILSQLRLVRFLWENGGCFPNIDQLYPREIRELGIGSQHLISINGDRPLREALVIMNNEGISSLAVVDNQYNVVGNISNVDVQLLTKSSSAPLLENTCIHFISVILSTRGMQDGKDSFPVFYINPYSTLAHTVAKLVATRSHRMWVVDASTPNSSTPSTPLSVHANHPHHPHHHHHSSSQSSISHSPPQLSTSGQPVPPSTHTLSHPSASPSHSAPITLTHPPVAHPPHLTTSLPAQANPPFQPLSATPSISASALPGQHISGRLSGVVSLTDVLNLFARRTGLNPEDPEEARRKRRGSSSSSRSGAGVRASLEGLRRG